MPDLAWLQHDVDAELIRFYVIPVVGWIGSDLDSFVRLAGHGVTARHCKIWRAADGCHLRDLAGGCRTRVNGKPVEQVRLRPGDEIRVGSTRLFFRQIEQGPTRVADPTRTGRGSTTDSAGLVGL